MAFLFQKAWFHLSIPNISSSLFLSINTALAKHHCSFWRGSNGNSNSCRYLCIIIRGVLRRLSTNRNHRLAFSGLGSKVVWAFWCSGHLGG